jgi:uncharacterized protein (TIGR03437 family)
LVKYNEASVVHKIVRTGFPSRVSAVIALLILISFQASGQTCIQSLSPVPVLRVEGLAESVGSVTLTCTGGTLASTATATLLVTMSSNITNRLDANGNPTNISVTVTTGGGTGSPAVSAQLFGSTTLALAGVQYFVLAGPTTITISGILVAPGNLPAGSSYLGVTAQVGATGGSISVSGTPVLVGQAVSSLLDSLNDNGIPCAGSPLPATQNFAFNDLIAAGTAFSTIRVTEAFATAFTPKAATADTGVRILINLTGYGSNTQVFVPDAIVGNTGSVATSAGDYATATVSAGAYTPGLNQLLLVRVNGTDANGVGGILASIPSGATFFSVVNPVSLTNGSGYVVYEVLSANPAVKEWAQIPVFVSAPPTVCPSTAEPDLSAFLAPVSTVAVATQTDPIPRFLAVTPGLDCTQIGDCSAAYFPVLVVNATSVTLNGSTLGAMQNGSFDVGNGGGGLLLFSVSIAYQSGSNWLSQSSTPVVNGTAINLTADPSALAQGTYQATVTVNAGVWGSMNVLVTFNVGPPGPRLAVSPTAVTLSGPSLGAAQQASLAVSNTGTGQLSFTVSVVAQSGGNWLSASPASGTNNTTINLTANPNLTVAPSYLLPGTYQATVTLNGGAAGTISVPVTFDVGPPGPAIQGIVNSANLQPGPITAGSYASIFGTGLAGTNVQVTFNSLAASVIYDGATQINVLVPAALGSATQASVVATINGQVSNTFTVSLTQNAPAVFNPGILNQDNSVNLATQPASVGSIVQIFLTGLATPVTAPVTVTIGSLTGLVPVYAGVSSISGLEQVNVQIPVTLTFTGNSAPLSICIAGSCSAPVNLYLH